MAQFVFNVGTSLQLIAPEALSAGGFRCWLKGRVGHSVTLQSSPDLVHWNDRTNMILNADLVMIVDEAREQKPRFYRAKSEQ